MGTAGISEFNYRIAWRSSSSNPGRHASKQSGLGMEFRGHTSLLNYPDPRRIDVRASLRDMQDQIWVRLFHQKSAVPIHILCDLSGSMGFVGTAPKMPLAARIVRSIACSAHRVNDPVGFIGFDETVREDFWFKPVHSLYPVLNMADHLETLHPGAAGSAGILNVPMMLASQRSLVFLISDFHFDLDMLAQVLDLLRPHQVVPVVLWDSGEYRNLPDWGIVTLADAESRQQRVLMMRRSLRERIQANFQQRRALLSQLCLAHHSPAFFVEDVFNSDALSEYFYHSAEWHA